MARTHYEVLGVPQTASAAEIKAAYRKLARSAHPDAGGSAAIFDIVKESYDELSDPARRAAYDSSITSPRSSSSYTRTAEPETETEHAEPTQPKWTYRDPAEDYPSREARSTVVDGPDPDAVPVRESDPIGNINFKRSFFVGLGTVVWFLLVDLLRIVENAVGVIDTDVRNHQNAISNLLTPIPIWFVFGALLVVIPWSARSDWRPFPRWEKVVVFVALAAAMPFGLEWFTNLSLFLSMVAAVTVYLFLVSRRSPEVHGAEEVRVEA